LLSRGDTGRSPVDSTFGTKSGWVVGLMTETWGK